MAPAGPPHRRRRKEASGVTSRGICVLARRAAPEAAASVTSRDPRGRAESASRGAWWRPREAAAGPSAPPPVVVPAASPPRLRPVSCSSGLNVREGHAPSVAPRAVRRVERWTEATRTATRLLPRAPSRAAAGAGAEQAPRRSEAAAFGGVAGFPAASLRPCGSLGRRGPAILPRGPPPLPLCARCHLSVPGCRLCPKPGAQRSRNQSGKIQKHAGRPRTWGRHAVSPQRWPCSVPAPRPGGDSAPGTSEAASVPVPGGAPAQGGPALGRQQVAAPPWSASFPQVCSKGICVYS